MRVLKQKYTVNSSVKDVWEALTIPKKIKNWTGAKAVMSDGDGFVFSLWDGDIIGKNTKVTKNKLLEQDWKYHHWENFSKVKIELKSKNNLTEVNLTQSGIPEDEFDDIADGWDRYYFGEIKNYLNI